MITLKDIEQIPEAEFHNLKFKSARGVSTDSRSISGGQVFFALRGEKFDGHNFVVDALGKGSVCAVVDRAWYRNAINDQLSAIGYPLVVVDDTTRALGDLANVYRRKFTMPVIAIGGSNGKTTTKEMVAGVLNRKFKVIKTSGNHNNQIGVSMTIFEFGKSHEIAVIEIGTNHLGEIKRLCEVLGPIAGLVTNIGIEHLEFFWTLNGVEKEEGSLFNYLKRTNGTAFVNADDRRLVRMSKAMKYKFLYGFRSGSAARKNLIGRMFGMDSNGCAVFEMNYRKRTELVRLKVPGVHNVMNALAAAAVGCYYGVSLSDIKKALEGHRSCEKRMQIVKAGGVTILNDTYNSNPESAVAAIRWLSVVRGKGKRIAVLADMLE